MSYRWTQSEFPPSPEVLAEWEHLLARIGLSHIQAQPWWLSIWWRHFGQGTPELQLLHDGDQLCAVLPLMQRSQREGRLPVARMIRSTVGEGFGDTISLALDGTESGLLSEVAARLDGLRDAGDEFRLCPLVASCGSERLRPLLEARGWESLRIEGNPLLSLEEGWEAASKKVGKNLRRDVAKKKRRLEEEGIHPELVLLRESTDGLIEELTELARLRFDAEQHKSAFLDDDKRAFIREAAAEAARRGLFACFTSRDGDRLMGYRFGFIKDGTFYDWITSYDPKYFPWSIGKLILWDLIEALCHEGVHRLDFMAGEEDYKLKWLPEVHDMWLCRYRKQSVANTALKAMQGLSRLKRGRGA